jgi:hypothetical protein
MNTGKGEAFSPEQYAARQSEYISPSLTSVSRRNPLQKDYREQFNTRLFEAQLNLRVAYDYDETTQASSRSATDLLQLIGGADKMRAHSTLHAQRRNVLPKVLAKGASKPLSKIFLNEWIGEDMHPPLPAHAGWPALTIRTVSFAQSKMVDTLNRQTFSQFNRMC